MGLDNGIILKCSDEIFKKIPYYDTDEIGNEDKHLAYWRKCYGIRKAILNKLHGKDGGDTPIEVEDIPAIIRVLKPFLSRDYWEENADSIWEYEEYFDNLYKILIRLEWLKEYLKDNPNVECYFYDSY
jgi:hypothetical protein